MPMRKKASESSEERNPGGKQGYGLDLLRLLLCGNIQGVVAKPWVVKSASSSRGSFLRAMQAWCRLV